MASGVGNDRAHDSGGSHKAGAELLGGRLGLHQLLGVAVGGEALHVAGHDLLDVLTGALEVGWARTSSGGDGGGQTAKLGNISLVYNKCESGRLGLRRS